MSLSYRWSRSHRHFIGKDEQEIRTEEGSEVINNVHLADVSITYSATPRLSFTLGIPFQVARRKSSRGRGDFLNGVKGANDSISFGNGIGDISLTGRYWMLKGGSESPQNVSLGLGIKLPTGKIASTSFEVNGGRPLQRFVDQSIQPGDGGVGVIFEVSGYKAVGPVLFTGGVTYLANPEEMDVPRAVSTPARPEIAKKTGENFLSIGDQYSIRVGGAIPVPKVRGLSGYMGVRMEGQPSTDLFGGNKGFRRPGYAISVDPGFSYTTGKDTFSMNIPVPFSRNRTRNIIDRFSVPRRKGDAAFSDYSIQFSYSRRF